MPSMVINPTVNGNSSIVCDYYLEKIYESGSEISSDATSFSPKQIAADDRANSITFNFGKSLGQIVPENTRVTSILLSYYYRYNKGSGFSPTIVINGKSSRDALSSASSFTRSQISFSLSQFSDLGSASNINLSYDSYQDYWQDVYTPNMAYVTNQDTIRTSPGVYPQQIKYRYWITIPNTKYFMVKDHTTSLRPTVTINYEYNPPVAPTSLAPDNSTQNPRTPIRFTWNSRINQQAFELQYQVNGGAWKTIKETSENRYYELAPGTITEATGTVNWKVRVAEQNMIYSDFVNASFMLGALPPQKPYLVFPVSDYIRNVRTLNFRWLFVPNTIETQTAFELKYKVDGDIWKTISEVTNRENVDIELNIDESKNVEWQLRLKNQFNEWSEWTDIVIFQIIGTPPMPQIVSVSNTNRPEIKWIARDQEMYKLEIYKDDIIVYETGKIVGVATRTHKVTQDLVNGKYLLRLTTYNIYDIESPTVEYTHIVNPEAIATPTISISKGSFGIIIESDAVDGLVIRDGKVIGSLEQGSFSDYSGVNGKVYNYRIRTYSEDVLADSETLSGGVDFVYNNTLATIDELHDYLNISYGLEKIPGKSLRLDFSHSFMHLDEVKYPVVDIGDNESEALEISFFIWEDMDLRKLVQIYKSKNEVLYRDCRGRNIQGFIDKLSYSHHILGYEVSITINKTGDFYD